MVGLEKLCKFCIHACMHWLGPRLHLARLCCKLASGVITRVMCFSLQMWIESSFIELVFRTDEGVWW